MRNARRKISTAFGILIAFACVCSGAPKSQIYDSSADGARQVANALAAARQTDKTVLVQFGGDWCVPCIQLYHFFETNPAVNSALKSRYIKIDIEFNDRNKLLFTNYHATTLGIPILVVLDTDGKRLSTIDTDTLLQSSNYSSDKVLALLAKWTPEAIRAKTTRQWVQELVSMDQSADKSIELEQIQKKPDEAVATLEEIILSGTNAGEQIAAYYALNHLGPLAKPPIPFLIRQFTTNNSLVQFTASTLSGFGPDAKPAVPTLENILNDPTLEAVADESAQRMDSRSGLIFSAAYCLAKIEPASPSLVPAMIKWVEAPNLMCRRGAPKVIERAGSLASAALPALRQACADSDETVRRNATNAISKITTR